MIFSFFVFLWSAEEPVISVINVIVDSSIIIIITITYSDIINSMGLFCFPLERGGAYYLCYKCYW